MAALNALLEALAARASNTLAMKLHVASAEQELSPDLLSVAERQRYCSLPTAARRADWLRGRRALKSVLSSLTMETDTAGYSMPHPQLSLTHSAHVALALGSPSQGQRGVGVDLELGRSPSAASARFFSTDNELAALERTPQSTRARALLRLWCIKEALFKANAQNAGTGLYQYEIDDLRALHGEARFCNHASARFRYACFEFVHEQRPGCIAFAAGY